MSLKSKLNIGIVGMYAAFAFYVVAGVVCFVLLPIANFPPHIGILGILSLVAAYGVLKKRVWTIWLAIILLFTATTFSAYAIYFLFGKDLISDISMIVYLVLTWAFTGYIVAKRKALES